MANVDLKNLNKELDCGEKYADFLGKSTVILLFFRSQRPRVKGRCLYPLINIIVITLCALICGANGWKGIEKFGHQRRRWLNQFLDLSNGIPSHLTFARIFALINPEEFQKCFMSWVKQITQLVTNDIIAIDGKTLRGSSHIRGGKPATHIINAYGSRQKITLGSVKTPDKSNEIKGIPSLLKLLNPSGCILTIDAMGTQKGIAKLIRMKRAHYVLALKKNHKRFYRKVDILFNRAEKESYRGMVFRKCATKNYDHSRIEEREYTILPRMYLHPYKKEWTDLEAFIQVKTVRHLATTVEKSVRYYLTSLPLRKYEKMSQAIREHWQVENSLHWKLDVGLHEDRCVIYRGFADENLATLRKMVLQLLQSDKSSTDGIEIKRLQAALNTRYLRKVVGF